MNIKWSEVAASTAAFASIIALTFAIVVWYPRKYESRAKLLLKVGRESVTLDPTVTTTRDTTSLHRTRESEINTTVDMMKNRAVLEDVAKMVGQPTIIEGVPPESGSKKPPGIVSRFMAMLPDLDPIADDEQVLIVLESNLSIKAARESGVVEVAYRTKSPEVAQQVVQSWTDVYRQAHAKLGQTAGATEFFANEELDARARLARAGEQLSLAKNRADMVTVAGQQLMLETQRLATRQAISTTEALLAASESRFQALAATAEQTPERLVGQESSVGNRAHELMRETLYRLEIEETKLEATYRGDHPRLTVVRKQREDAEKTLANHDDKTIETIELLNPLSQLVAQQLVEESANQSALKKRLGVEKSQLEQLRSETVALNNLRQEIQRLETEFDVLSVQHRLLLEKLEQARLTDDLDTEQITSINVVQHATFEASPVTPNKRLCLLVGSFAAICGAIGVPLLLRSLPSNAISKNRNGVYVANSVDEVQSISGQADDHGDTRKHKSSASLLPR